MIAVIAQPACGCTTGRSAKGFEMTIKRAVYFLKFRSFIVSFMTIGLAAACSPPQPLNFSVLNVQPSPTALDEDLRAVTVTPAAPNERTGELPPEVADVTNTWKEATQEALARAAIFRDDSHNHVNLEVKILKFDAPGAGITFPTDTDAKYTLIDRASGKVVFTQIISAQGTTPMGFAFIGAIRARESINRSAQNNIAAFIKALENAPSATSPTPAPTS
jgi:hypothetical protein